MNKNNKRDFDTNFSYFGLVSSMKIMGDKKILDSKNQRKMTKITQVKEDLYNDYQLFKNCFKK